MNLNRASTRAEAVRAFKIGSRERRAAFLGMKIAASARKVIALAERLGDKVPPADRLAIRIAKEEIDAAVASWERDLA